MGASLSSPSSSGGSSSSGSWGYSPNPPKSCCWSAGFAASSPYFTSLYFGGSTGAPSAGGWPSRPYWGGCCPYSGSYSLYSSLGILGYVTLGAFLSYFGSMKGAMFKIFLLY